MRYNYLKVLPREYITNPDTNHFSLNTNKIVELKVHYNRGWKSNENLRQLPKQLNEEQSSLQINGIIIGNDEKLSQYLRKLYRSGTFNDKTVIAWNNKPTEDQTYANPIILFETGKDGMDKMCRLTGNKKLVNNGFSSANAVIEWGNEVKDVIKTAVTASIQQKITSTPSLSRKCAPPTNASCKKYCKRSPPSARESTD